MQYIDDIYGGGGGINTINQLIDNIWGTWQNKKSIEINQRSIFILLIILFIKQFIFNTK